MIARTGTLRRAKGQANHHIMQHSNAHFLEAGNPSCHPTNSVKTLKTVNNTVNNFLFYTQH